MNQPPLNLPPVDLKIRRDGSLIKVFDPVREKYVALTPEEYVRQHFCAWLINQKHYPKSILGNEVSIILNDTKRRCDTVVFRPDGRPRMIIEYKAPTIGITQEVFDQIARYNMVLKSDYLVVSNGISHYCCRMDYEKDTYEFVRNIPDYDEPISQD